MVSQNPVLSGNGHYICSNSCRYKIKIRKQGFFRFVVFLGDRLDQLKTNPATTKFIIRIITVLTFWIQYCNSIGDLTAGTVVVTNYKIHPFFSGIGYFLYSFNATIQRNNQANIIICGIIYTLVG